jgi:hypothetical protein
VSLVTIKSSWAPRVRYAARKYKRELRKAQRNFEKALARGTTEGEAMSVLCAEEAKAVLEMLKRLGYGSEKPKTPARDRLELELMVHERDEDPSINFFRLFMAQQKGTPLEQVFSRKGRERTKEKAQAFRLQHINELTTALKARKLAYEWLSQYYGRMEIRKKYNEFARVQFDQSLDDEAKAAYMALLFEQIANRSGRTPDEMLEEFNSMVKVLGLEVPSAEIRYEYEDDGAEDGEGED